MQAAARDFGVQRGKLHASLVRGGVYALQHRCCGRLRNLHRWRPEQLRRVREGLQLGPRHARLQQLGLLRGVVCHRLRKLRRCRRERLRVLHSDRFEQLRRMQYGRDI